MSKENMVQVVNGFLTNPERVQNDEARSKALAYYILYNAVDPNAPNAPADAGPNEKREINAGQVLVDAGILGDKLNVSAQSTNKLVISSPSAKAATEQPSNNQTLADLRARMAPKASPADTSSDAASTSRSGPSK